MMKYYKFNKNNVVEYLRASKCSQYIIKWKQGKFQTDIYSIPSYAFRTKMVQPTFQVSDNIKLPLSFISKIFDNIYFFCP